jgi:hypothetical protein
MVSTLAGNGTAGYADGRGELAQFNYPHGVALDNKNNVYVADYSNHRYVCRARTTAAVWWDLSDLIPPSPCYS